MGLSREEFLRKKVAEAELFELPSGGEVLLQPLGVKQIREWRNAQRSSDGELDLERAAYGTELLVARALVEPNGNRMFSDDEILTGALDEINAVDMSAVSGRVSEISGLKAKGESSTNTVKN